VRLKVLRGPAGCAAGVDRSFVYRHRDLLQLIARRRNPTQPHPVTGPVVSRASPQADLLAAQKRAARQAARIQQLELRLSGLLGEQTWCASGVDRCAKGDVLGWEPEAGDRRLRRQPRAWADR